MHEMEKALVLFENVINRVEVVENSFNFKLPGYLTRNEFESMKKAAVIMSIRVCQVINSSREA